MAWDPFAPKQLAAVIAVGGLSFMMLEPVPNWGSVGIGIASIVGFLGLSLFPSARQAEPAAEPEFDSPAPEWPPARRTLDLLDNRPPPPPSRLLASQPVVFKVMRERRRTRRG